MITPVKDILKKAQKEGYAVGAFNTTNLETTRAIVEAAKELRSPVIIQITEKTMEYAGGRAIYNLVKNIAEFYAPEIPIGIHLDHGKSMEIIQRCVEIGFPSVMYDGSRKILDDNTTVTRKVVEYCHKRRVCVQGELGSVPYIGETDMGDVDWDKYMTDPEEAENFVCQTGVDALAVAIGNAHGFFKERKEPDYDRLEEIHKRVKVPLVLHGASDWENGKVTEVIKRGVCCFNVDTATRLAFVNSLVKAVGEQHDVAFDIRHLLGDAKDAVKEIVKEKIKWFGSNDKVEMPVVTECVSDEIRQNKKIEGPFADFGE